MCPLYDIVAHRYCTTSLMTGTDCIYGNAEAYMHTYTAAAFNKQCGSMTIITSFDHVNGWQVTDRMAL